MKCKFWMTAAAVIAAAVAGPAAQAAVIYTENFDVDSTANWTVNEVAPNPTDKIADFYYDYSAIGVPAAPGGSTTRGLKMTANNSAAIFGGFSVSPTGKNFTGDYRVSFQMWQNYVGPLGAGGSGTTQLSTYGIGTSGTTVFWPGAATKESVAFATTLDSGSATDVRVYSSAAPTSYAAGNAVYSAPAGVVNLETNAYYTAAFPAQAAPAAQLALFSGQTGSTDAGETSFAWRNVVIDVSGGIATWSIDGLNMAKVNLTGLTLGGGNIFFGHSDTNTTSSSDPNDTLLNVTLIDNIVVSQVPEPSCVALFATALVGVAAFRRRVC